MRRVAAAVLVIGSSAALLARADSRVAAELVAAARERMLPGNLPHIGIVVDGRSADGRRPLIVHNIGGGPRMEDILFAYEITGHYRYLPPAPE